jgi:hypothetical protein
MVENADITIVDFLGLLRYCLHHLKIQPSNTVLIHIVILLSALEPDLYLLDWIINSMKLEDYLVPEKYLIIKYPIYPEALRLKVGG